MLNTEIKHTLFSVPWSTLPTVSCRRKKTTMTHGSCWQIYTVYKSVFVCRMHRNIYLCSVIWLNWQIFTSYIITIQNQSLCSLIVEMNISWGIQGPRCSLILLIRIQPLCNSLGPLLWPHFESTALIWLEIKQWNAFFKLFYWVYCRKKVCHWEWYSCMKVFNRDHYLSSHASRIYVCKM
jgi:hypothetical protein